MSAEAVNLGFSATGYRECFDHQPASDAPLYGQIVISTALVNQQIAWDSIFARAKNVFVKDVKSIGLKITPIVGGVALPQIVPLSVSRTAGTYQSDIAPTWSSPWVRLTPGTSFEIKLDYSASNNETSKIATTSLDLAQVAGELNPSSWAISQATLPIISNITATADQTLSQLLSTNVQTSIDETIVPVAQQRKGISIRFADLANKPFLMVVVEVKLANSLLNSPLPAVPTTRSAAIPSFAVRPTPLTVLQKIGGTTSDKIGAVFKSDPNWNGLHQQTVSTFENACQQFFDSLQASYGFNEIDQALLFEEVLIETNTFTETPSLFSSHCVRPETFNLLAQMGVPLTAVGTALQISADQFLSLGDFMEHPTDSTKRAAVAQFFNGPTVLLVDRTGPAIADPNKVVIEQVSPADALTYLGKIGITSYCGFFAPLNDQPNQHLGMGFSWRVKLDNKLYVLLAYGGNQGSVQNGIAQVTTRVASDADGIPGRCRSGS